MGRISEARSLAVQAPQALGNLAGAGLVLAFSYRDLAYLLAAVIAFTALYLGSRTARWTPSSLPADTVADPAGQPGG
jgi:hypothetical protein